MNRPARMPRMSLEDYLARRPADGLRREYVDGEVFILEAASRRHATIAGNLFVALQDHVRARGGRLHAGTVPLRLDIANICYLPDLLVTLAPDDTDPTFVRKPCLVVEVMSDASEATDRREKRPNCLRAPSICEFVLVSENERHVEVYRRDGVCWSADIVLDGSVTFDGLGFEIALDALYES
ncbi:Uma2 family endonuclease [Azospirillum sp. YIM B02556]|uniref:Uma2 family endonuclease n=2 Tax=Azospirillum endophyticum TaxID=2800326 RepID=A0ABS1F7F6_9PROT|nr:Uma2 family endonuclease [Azospirillum endophyticum]